MKRRILQPLALLFAGMLLLGACAPKAVPTVSPKSDALHPELKQIKTISELATLQCYYHNVAKSTKTAGSGIIHIGEKDRKFWIEYTGVAKIGIDTSEIRMELDGTRITIFIPRAKLLSIDIVESDLSESSYIASSDGVNKNKITAWDQTRAINDAQEEMAQSVKNNKTLLANAQNQAKAMIANYIESFKAISDITYQINWIYQGDAEDVSLAE